VFCALYVYFQVHACITTTICSLVVSQSGYIHT
jgi:hypothetical protein